MTATVGDMRDPKAILTDDEIRAAGFDLDAPACVILACVILRPGDPLTRRVARGDLTI